MKRFILLLIMVMSAQAVQANDYYNATGAPAAGSALASATIRNEYASVEDGFDKLPTMTGNGALPVFVNSGGTALEAASAATARTRLGISATNTPFTPTGTIAASDTQAAVAEVSGDVTTNAAAIALKFNTADATAANITNVPAGQISGATVQAAINELDLRYPVPPSGVEIVGGISGLTMSNAADTDHDITISAGACLESTGLYRISLAAAITKKIDENWVVGTNSGGLLNGGVSANELYHVYLLLKDSDSSVDMGFLDQDDAIGSYLPAGYSYYRWIGFVITDASSNIRNFTHIKGDVIVLNAAFEILTNVNTASLTSQDIAGFIPAGRVETVTVAGNDNASPAGHIELGNNTTEAEVGAFAGSYTTWAGIIDAVQAPTGGYGSPVIVSVHPSSTGAIFINTDSVSTDIWIKAIKIIR